MQNKKSNKFIKFPLWLFEWEWIDEGNYLTAFMRMVDRANKDDARWHGIDIARGEFVTSTAEISKLCGMTSQKIRTFIKRCEDSGLIEKKASTTYTVIRILNYDYFQGNIPKFEKSAKINIDANKKLTQLPTYSEHPANSNITSNSDNSNHSANIVANTELTRLPTQCQQGANKVLTTNKEYNRIYNNYIDDVEGEEPAKAGTTPPTLTEVRAFCFDKNSIVDPVRFYNYYSTRNWQGVGDWKLKIEEWENNQFSTADKQRVDKIASYRAFEAGKNNEIDLEQFFEN